MLTARELFPRDETSGSELTLQGRILIRVSGGTLRPSDIRLMTAAGILKAHDDPDEVHGMAIHG